MIGSFKVVRPARCRPADLYVTEGHRQGGVVLVGDAFATSCPAAGTGTSKVLTDVERLCNVHIPAWLATDGMDADKIAAFYDDPVKVTCDAACVAKAVTWCLRTLDNGLAWRTRRWARFLVRAGQGMMIALHKRLGAQPRASEHLPVPDGR